MIAFKYRSNINIRHDTFSLLQNEIFVPNLLQLNDPYEEAVFNALIVFSKKDLSKFGEANRILEKYRQNVGIYSMSLPKDPYITYPDNELMWAHYANSHKGFCLAYDVDILISDYVKQKTVKMVKVIYENWENINLSQHDIYQSLLGIKSPNWLYENEIRLIFDSPGIKEYSYEALKAVYFGSRMKQQEREIIIKNFDGDKVDFYEIIPEKNKYRLIALKISSNDIYRRDRLPERIYEILSSGILATVQNFTVLYKDLDKSSNAIEYFIYKFRQEHAIKASNITVIDDKMVEPLLDKKPLTIIEHNLLSEHWVAFSSFDAPDYIWMYPAKEDIHQDKLSKSIQQIVGKN
ncbi:MAG: DUF2971 domain-containing protein [Bacteroidales bacterium]|nr:DUF2971 domain-containing protein [Bacteroidales bacterium]